MSTTGISGTARRSALLALLGLSIGCLLILWTSRSVWVELQDATPVEPEAVRESLPSIPPSSSTIEFTGSKEINGGERPVGAPPLADGQSSEDVEPSVSTPAIPQVVPAVERPAPGDVEVTVQWYQSSSPAFDIAVRLVPADGRSLHARLRSRRTSENGVARFVDIEPGEVAVETDRLSSAGKGTVVSGQTLRLLVTLMETCTVTGTVFDERGAPAAGSDIHILSDSPCDRKDTVAATTNREGRFEIRSPKGLAVYAVKATSLPSALARIGPCDAGATLDVELHLGGAGETLRLKISGSPGRPAQGTTVCLEQIRLLRGPDLAELGPLWSGVTDSAGLISIEGLAPGSYRLGVIPIDTGNAPWVHDVEVSGATQLDISLRPGGCVFGLVSGPDGLPREGAVVRFGYACDWDSVSCVSSPDGYYVLSGVPAGSGGLEAHLGRLHSKWMPVSVAEGATKRLDVTLAPSW